MKKKYIIITAVIAVILLAGIFFIVNHPTTYFTVEPVENIEDDITPFVLTEEDFKKHPVFNDCLKDSIVRIDVYSPNMPKPFGAVDEYEYNDILKNYGGYLLWNDKVYRIKIGPRS